MPTNHETWTSRHFHHRKQSRAIWQLHVQFGCACIEALLGSAEARRGTTNQVDEFFITLHNWPTTFTATVTQLDPNRVTTTNMNVTHIRVIQQSLETAEPKYSRQYVVHERLFINWWPSIEWTFGRYARNFAAQDGSG